MDKETADLNRKRVVGEGAADGIYAAAILLCSHEKIDTTPSKTFTNPIDSLVDQLTWEYGKAHPGTLQIPIKEKVDAICNEHIPAIDLLIASNDHVEAKKLVRWLVCGQVLDLLHPEKDKIRAFIDGLRQEAA